MLHHISPPDNTAARILQQDTDFFAKACSDHVDAEPQQVVGDGNFLGVAAREARDTPRLLRRTQQSRYVLPVALQQSVKSLI